MFNLKKIKNRYYVVYNLEIISFSEWNLNKFLNNEWEYYYSNYCPKLIWSTFWFNVSKEDNKKIINHYRKEKSKNFKQCCSIDADEEWTHISRLSHTEWYDWSWNKKPTYSLKEAKKNIENKRKKNIEKRKKYRKKITIKQVLISLNACFTINKNVKAKAYEVEKMECYCWWEDDYCDRCWGSWYYNHTHVDYGMRDNMYEQKKIIISKAIKAIKENRLPIKYGKNDWIIYFEYLWKQVSFHDPKDLIECKRFNWIWNEKPNKKIPFIIT